MITISNVFEFFLGGISKVWGWLIHSELDEKGRLKTPRNYLWMSMPVELFLLFWVYADFYEEELFFSFIFLLVGGLISFFFIIFFLARRYKKASFIVPFLFIIQNITLLFFDEHEWDGGIGVFIVMVLMVFGVSTFLLWRKPSMLQIKQETTIQKEKQSICKKCGSKLLEGFNFCRKCGTKQ